MYLTRNALTKSLSMIPVYKSSYCNRLVYRFLFSDAFNEVKASIYSNWFQKILQCLLFNTHLRLYQHTVSRRLLEQFRTLSSAILGFSVLNSQMLLGNIERAHPFLVIYWTVGCIGLSWILNLIIKDYINCCDVKNSQP